MGISQSMNTETINWNNVNTDDMSSTLPNLNKISDEAKQLITKLNLPGISDNNSEFDANFIFNEEFNEQNNEQSNSIFNTNNQDGGSDHEENNTSPFITSEMYNYIINKYNTNTNDVMTGGASKKGKKMIGGTSDDDNSSETSSTSSSADLSSSESSESTIKGKKDKKEKKGKESVTHELSSPEGEEAIADRFEGKKKRVSKAKKGKKSYKGSENYLSYVSSSAHTDEYKSVKNENNYSISSVNTSDINMISDN